MYNFAIIRHIIFEILYFEVSKKVQTLQKLPIFLIFKGVLSREWQFSNNNLFTYLKSAHWVLANKEIFRWDRTTTDTKWRNFPYFTSKMGKT